MRTFIRLLSIAGGSLLLIFGPAGSALEANMARHMLIQIPLLVVLGYFSVQGLNSRWPAASLHLNAHGITGLLLVMLVNAFWMLPTALDLAVIDPRVDAIKAATLVLGGAALNFSWRAAGVVIQAFFLGNWCAMEILAGLLYQEASQPLCSAYLVNDQVDAGVGMVILATAISLLWGTLQIRRSIAAESALVGMPDTGGKA